MGKILIDVSSVVAQAGIRAKAGAKPGADGVIADEDQEVFIAFCVGCIKAGPAILGHDGKRRGVMAPVAVMTAPYVQVAAQAEQQFEAMDGNVTQ